MSASAGALRPSLYRRAGKRALDLLLAVPALVVAAPVIAVLAALVALSMGRPVLFRQLRAGRGGMPFQLVKLRTMRHPAATAAPGPADDERRLTPLGRFLRRWSLDELPELWNVVRGEMSLVGPRPLLLEYLPRYDARQRRRHDVRPGLTGWAQVHGRNATKWSHRLELDAWYAESLSLGLDLSILARTVLAVIRGAGVSAHGVATMPRFGEGGDSE